MEIEKCEAVFHIPFNATIMASTYKYQVEVFHIIPVLNIEYLIASGNGQLTITGTVCFNIG